MAQDAILLAFRKRLKKRGYSDIHIYKSKELPQHYITEAREPLAHTKVKIEDHIVNYHYKMR